MSFTTKKPAGEITRRLTVYLSRTEELELERLVRETKTSKAALALQALRDLMQRSRMAPG